MKLRLSRPSPAMLVAVTALFVGLGGSAFAVSNIGTNDLKNQAVTTEKIDKRAVTAGRLARDSVKSGKIRDDAVKTDRLRNNAVKSSKIDNGAVKRDKVEDAAINNSKLANPTYWALITGNAPAVARTNGATGVTRGAGPGNYFVAFETGVSGCSFQVTTTKTGGFLPLVAGANVDATDPTLVRVRTRNPVGIPRNTDFSIAVHC